mgnify:FL=1
MFLIFILYLLLNFILSGFYNTLPAIIKYANSIDWFKLGVSIVLTVIIGLLVAFNSVLVYIKHKERKRCREGIATAGVGSVGGLIVGICPLCITGLFPLIFGAIGVSFSFASLPFEGIEIQVLVVAILLVSLRMLKKNE